MTQPIIHESEAHKHFEELILMTGTCPKPSVAEKCRLFLTSIKPMLLIAPASTSVRFHHARPGGLLQHIHEVLRLARATAQGLPSQAAFADLTAWNLYLCAVLHDIHKACDWSGRAWYVPNILKGGKRSEAIPYQTNDVCFSFIGQCGQTGAYDQRSRLVDAASLLLHRNRDLLPGGELSLLMVNVLDCSFYESIPDAVKYAIRHHEGAYSVLRNELAGKETPLQQVLHFADMISSRSEGWTAPKALQ